MIFEISDDPDAAVQKQDDTGTSFHVVGLHDEQLDVTAIDRERLFSGGDAGHIDLGLVL